MNSIADKPTAQLWQKIKLCVSDVSPVLHSLGLNPCIPINGGEGKARHRVVEKEMMEFYHPFWMLPSFGMG